MQGVCVPVAVCLRNVLNKVRRKLTVVSFNGDCFAKTKEESNYAKIILSNTSINPE